MSEQLKGPRAQWRRNGLRIYFLVSAGLALFAAGFAFALLKLPPYEAVMGLVEQIGQWQKYPRHYLRMKPEAFLAPANRISPETVVESPDAAAMPGDTFVTGFFGDSAGMKLIDMQGRTLHEWRVAYHDAFPTAPHMQDVPRHPWDTHFHGAILYPDGDVVFNFENGGLVRIDRCSRVKWRIAQQTHHSVAEDADGNLWVPGRRLRTKPVKEYPNVPAPFQEEYILKVSPDGKILKEISILGTLFKAKYDSVLFANGDHQLDIPIPPDRDFTHLNDVEPLTPQMAGAFPQFVVGDLLVSLRNLNLLFVMSPETGEIKWSMVGPYLRQHDPDFLANGHISVFDNRRDNRSGRIRGGSRILELDPVTRHVTTLFGGRPDEFFYTGRMGADQRLPNGNLLITASEAGYAFEATPQRKVVWSFINHWDKQSVAWVDGATRYPQSYWVPKEGEVCR